MKTRRDREKISKYLSYLLRHKPEKEGLKLDNHGYTSVEILCQKLDISKDDLDWIVDTNNKKRFAYNEDETLIRANQGHSINVDVELEKVNPPHKLYHGTSWDNLDSIKKNGLMKMNRQHVHLSADQDTAITVGRRHSKGNDPMVLIIDAKLMHFNGYKIYLSKNGVYLTDHVPIDYIKILPNAI
jgi:putative RNA 2'-phosphotransferase